MSYFCLNLGQTAEDSDLFTIIWLRPRRDNSCHERVLNIVSIRSTTVRSCSSPDLVYIVYDNGRSMHARTYWSDLQYIHHTRTDIHTKHENIHSAIISQSMLSWWAVMV